MADKVTRLVSSTPVRGTEAQAKVVAFLRSQADAIEKGEEPGTQKAIVILYKDVGEQFAVRSRFCNVTSIERTGMLYMAAHDALTAG